jgi:CHAT domain-containing protein
LLQVVKNQQAAPDSYNLLSIIAAHNNLGLLYYNQGRFDDCRRELTQNYQTIMTRLPANHTFAIEGRVNLGWLELTRGNLEAAETAFRSALETLKAQSPGHPRLAEFKSYLARVLVEQQKPDEARQLMFEALDARINEALQTLDSALSQRDRLAYVQKLRVHTESLAWPGVLDTFLELAASLRVECEQQYSYVLAWKGILSRGGLSVPKVAGDSESGKLLAELQDVRSQIRKAAGNLAAGADPSLLVGLEGRAAELERQLRRLVPERQRGETVTAAQVAAALPPDVALVDIIEARAYLPREAGTRVEDNRTYVAFVVNGDDAGKVTRVDLGAAEDVDDSGDRASQVDQVVDNLVQRIRSGSTFRRQALTAGSLIGKPIRDAVGNSKLVAICADGSLHRLPWAALPGKDPQKYWLEEVTLAMVPTAHALVHSPHRDANAAPEWLVVGGVDYDAPNHAGGRWSRLPNTRSEAEDIVRLFRRTFTRAPGEPVLAGGDATKQAVVANLAKRNIIHLATHGDFQDRGREAFAIEGLSSYCDSFLVFAGANGAADPSQAVLTAEEIADLDLRETELVTMSACETALGHVIAGQGLIGLVDALTRAGAQAVVSATWNVDDRATALLMANFYRQLLATAERNVAQSLRLAQLELLNDESGAYRHPVFWAAWTAATVPRGQAVPAAPAIE